MKKLVVFILLLAFMAPAQYLFHRRVAFRSQGAPPPAAGTILFPLETFDTTPGYDQTGWAGRVAGGHDPDYTTIVLDGTESLFLSTDPSYVSNSISPAHNQVTLSGMFMIPELPAGGDDEGPYILDANGGQLTWMRWGGGELATNGYFRIYNGTQINGSRIAGIRTNTAYHFWLEYDGVSSVSRLYGGLDRRRPPAWVGYGTGNGTADAAWFRLHSNADPQFIFDNIKVVAGVTGDATPAFGPETFDGTGYVLSGWAEAAGTPNEDYTTTILNGTHSLALLTSGDTVTNSLGGSYADFELHFRFSPEGAFGGGTADGPVYIQDEAGNNLMRVRWDDDGTTAGRLILYHGTVSANGPYEIALNNDLEVWIRYYSAGVGGDGIAELYYNKDMNYEGRHFHPKARITTGNASPIAAAKNIYLTAQSVDYILDEVTLYEVPIVDIDDVPGLLAWYAASDISSTDGTEITSWSDKSGNGYTLTAGTGTGPTWEENEVNSLPALLFNGTTDYMTNNSLGAVFAMTTDESYTAFIVAKKTSNSGIDALFAAGYTGDSDTLVEVDTNTGKLRTVIRDDPANLLIVQSTGDVATSAYQLFTVQISGNTGNATQWANGGGMGSGDIYSTIGTLSCDRFTVGARNVGAALENYLDGAIAELVIFQTDQLDRHQEQVEAILASKYNINLFTPPDAGGMIAWYAADSIDSTDGTEQTSWADLSGNGYTLTANSGTGPTWETNAVNSKPALLFNGTSDFMTNAAIASQFSGTDIARTVFAVVKAGNYADTQAIIAGTYTGNNNNLWEFDVNQLIHPPRFAIRDSVATLRLVEATSNASTNSFQIVAMSTTGTAADMYVNGTKETAAGDADVTAVTIDRFTVGSRWTSGGFFFYWTGYIAELLVYDTALSSENIAAVNRYLADKYAITLP